MTIRKTRLKRSTKPIARKTRPKKVNKPRKAKEFARAYGGPERVEFVASLGCVVKRSWSRSQRGVVCEGQVENAHIGTGGMGRKAPYQSITSLCARHHRLLHALGSATFEGIYGLTLLDTTIDTERRWQAECARRDTLKG